MWQSKPSVQSELYFHLLPRINLCSTGAFRDSGAGAGAGAGLGNF